MMHTRVFLVLACVVSKFVFLFGDDAHRTLGAGFPLLFVLPPGARSKVAVSAGKDARSDPEFLLEKLGGFDFASAAGEGGGGGKGLEALSQLKQTLAKVFIDWAPSLMVVVVLA